MIFLELPLALESSLRSRARRVSLDSTKKNESCIGENGTIVFFIL